MTRINRISTTLCALLFTTLPFTPMAYASKQARTTPTSTHPPKTVGKKKSATTSQETTKTNKRTAAKTTSKTNTKTASSSKERTATPAKSTKTANRRDKAAAAQATTVAWTEKCTPRKGHKPRYMKVKATTPTTFAGTHEVKVQKATKTAMSALINQISKPYRWGNSSPRTGFDCSGLVYYAYKDLMKFHIPHIADEIYHLRSAALIEHSGLKNGDLVFFRTQGCGATDRVDVYVGDDRFIQSPHSGQEVRIASLSEDYWQRHYMGARRVMTPKTVR